ncbi:5,6-dimethylbenzimidazole synthase [Sphingomonas montanisoli]|uniref:5,6-dimethylbenzimidazole synthase n=1 Tax=Sphingomonas montanisoli TaxID=2606412 RepID=A0A5D9CCD3_9SPHN|nr:5,6-dimethylbenzimidazole synthase [Sphingomonas montanisoli]TZG27791.1 5,6-dimethylbenzimidazole synthase [Sphingomonas montanisoli]
MLSWRRDVRHFDTRAIDAAVIERLFELAQLAPSVGNAQPWRFVRVKTAKLRETLAAHVDERAREAGAAYGESERAALYASLKLHGLREAPEIVAVFCDEEPPQGHGLGRATMPEALRYSTVLAIHTLWLAAQNEGIGLGWVSIVDPAFVAALIEVPAQWSFVALLCIGYPVAPSDTPELERRGWQARGDWRVNVSER